MNKLIPVKIALLMSVILYSTVISAQIIEAMSLHSLTLCENGTVNAFGNNSTGQLGDGTTFPGIAPVQVSGLSGITAIATGNGHSLFFKR